MHELQSLMGISTNTNTITNVFVFAYTCIKLDCTEESLLGARARMRLTSTCRLSLLPAEHSPKVSPTSPGDHQLITRQLTNTN